MDDTQEKTEILRVLIGSQAHGLAGPESDYDYRGVFVVRTASLLKLGQQPPKHTSWVEGGQDDVQWEIGKFLFLATKCNPTILEVFLAPTVDTRTTAIGIELRRLFGYVWNSVGVHNAFIGYGLNQRKKFLDNSDARAAKYAVAYLRSLYNAYELLTTGTFSVDMRGTPIYDELKEFKNGNFTNGGVIDSCWKMERMVDRAFDDNPDKKTNFDMVNEFLLSTRIIHW